MKRLIAIVLACLVSLSAMGQTRFLSGGKSTGWQQPGTRFMGSAVVVDTTNFYLASSGNDANSGNSTAAPWKTIAKLNAATLQAGDSVFFNKGDMWREGVLVPNSGTVGVPIVFTTYGTGVNPILNGSVLVTSWTDTSNMSYATQAAGRIIWQNDTALTVRASIALCDANTGSYIYTGGRVYVNATSGKPSTNGKTYEAGSLSETFDFNEQDYVVLDGIDQTQTVGSTATVGGIQVDGEHGIVQNLSSYNHERHGLTFYTGAKYCLANNVNLYTSLSTSVFATYGAVADTTIQDTLRSSTLTNRSGTGSVVNLHGAAKNIVLETSDFSDATEAGVAMLNLYGSGSLATVRRNTLHGSGTGAIMIGAGGSGANGCEIYYNLFKLDSLTDTGGSDGVYVTECTGTKIYNNTFVGDNNQPAIRAYSNATGTLIKNNISQADQFVQVDALSQASTQCDYNLVNGNWGTWGTDAYTTLATWVAAANLDSNSISGVPGFTSASVFTLQDTSHAINTGVSVSLTTDRAGNSLTGVPDIGAYEKALAAAAPTVTTVAATSVSTTTATVNGTVDANLSRTTARFVYGTSTTFSDSATATQSPVSGTAATAVSKGLTGLTAGTEYYFRAVGSNTAGYVRGVLDSLTTVAADTIAFDRADSVTFGTAHASPHVLATVIDSGTNQYSVIGVAMYASGVAIDSVTMGGVKCDSLVSLLSSNTTASLYGIKNRSSGNDTVRVYTSVSAYGSVGVVNLFGVHQTTPVVASARLAGSDVRDSVLITSSAGQWVVSVTENGSSRTFVAAAPQVIAWSIGNNADGDNGACSYKNAAGTMDFYTMSGTGGWRTSAIVLQKP